MVVDNEIAQWVAGGAAAVATFLLKHLHDKINEAANKADLIEAMRLVAAQRMEDIHRIEGYQSQRLDAEKAIFERLRVQEEMLARIDERTAKMDCS